MNYRIDSIKVCYFSIVNVQTANDSGFVVDIKKQSCIKYINFVLGIRIRVRFQNKYSQCIVIELNVFEYLRNTWLSPPKLNIVTENTA